MEELVLSNQLFILRYLYDNADPYDMRSIKERIRETIHTMIHVKPVWIDVHEMRMSPDGTRDLFIYRGCVQTISDKEMGPLLNLCRIHKFHCNLFIESIGSWYNLNCEEILSPNELLSPKGPKPNTRTAKETFQAVLDQLEDFVKRNQA